MKNIMAKGARKRVVSETDRILTPEKKKGETDVRSLLLRAKIPLRHSMVNNRSSIVN